MILQPLEGITDDQCRPKKSTNLKFLFLPMNIPQRVFVVEKTYQGRSYEDIKRKFEKKFGMPCPTSDDINFIIQKFESTGEVFD